MTHTISVTSLWNEIWSLVHRFHTTSNSDLTLTSQNLCSCKVNSLQTRATENIQCHSRCLNWNTCIHCRLTSYILSLTCLKYTAHVNHVNLLCRNTRSLQCFLDNSCTKVNNWDILELSAHLTDCCTTCTSDYDSLSHFVLPPKNEMCR